MSEIEGFRVGLPQGAFYLFPEVTWYFGKSDGERQITDSASLAMYLLEKAHVAVVGGEGFGAPDCLRLSYATSEEELVEAVRRIKEALAQLR